MYRSAYEYVKTSPAVAEYCREVVRIPPSDCRAGFSDTVVFMESELFTSETIAAQKQQSRRRVIDSLIADDVQHEQAFKPFSVRTWLADLDNAEEPRLGLFFSAPRGRTLMAEVVGWYARGTTYQAATSFKSGILFLFFFDEEGRITRVITKNVQHES